jgi:pyruvate ferredoxin oxidoreductase alpha subunit
VSIAPQVNEDWLMEIRRQSDQAVRRARGVILEAYSDFHAKFGRGDQPFIESYMMEDAEVALVGMGTLAMSVRVAVREMRKQGMKVGFVRVKWFRPFPTPELQEALSGVKAVGVIDRDFSFGSVGYAGVLANELRAALYPAKSRPKIVPFIAGLGGREVTKDNVLQMTRTVFDAVSGDSTIDQDCYWIGARE